MGTTQKEAEVVVEQSPCVDQPMPPSGHPVEQVYPSLTICIVADNAPALQPTARGVIDAIPCTLYLSVYE